MRRMLLLFSLVTAVSASLAAPLAIVAFTPSAVHFNGTLYLPARPFGEMLGVPVSEHPTSGVTTLRLGDRSITFTPGSKVATANGQPLTLEDAPFPLIHGGLAVPVAPLAEALGLTCMQTRRQLTVTFPDAKRPGLTFRVEDGFGDTAYCYEYSWTLFVMKVDGSELRRLSYANHNGMGMGMVSFSPDGKFLLTYNGDCEVIMRPVDAREERVVCKLGGAGVGLTLPVSADGKAFYLHENNQLLRVSLADGARTALGPATFYAISPDRKYLAAVENQGAMRTLSLISLEDNTRQAIGPGAFPVFSPDSGKLIYRIAGGAGEEGNEHDTLAFYTITGAQAGQRAAYRFTEGRGYPLAISADGTQVLVNSSTNQALYVLNLATRQSRKLQPWKEESPVIASRFVDGDKAVITQQAWGDIYRVNIDGTGLTRLTRGLRIETFTLTPDGRFIVFLGARGD